MTQGDAVRPGVTIPGMDVLLIALMYVAVIAAIVAAIVRLAR